jgi:prolyl-tRNA editing enzyme YbaK/EbsC (Cys-tRNA(Pro) deacylase)
MNIQLGNFAFLPAKEYPELLSGSVYTAIQAMPNGGDAGVVEIDPDLSDTALFCEQYGVTADQAANCVVLEAKRADKSWFAACVILGSTRADVNGSARRTLDARRVSFAPMEQAVTQTGMEYGAITPVGLPADWTVLIDQAVVDSPYVIIGSGIRRSKLAVPGSFLASLPNAVVVQDLAQVRS